MGTEDTKGWTASLSGRRLLVSRLARVILPKSQHMEFTLPILYSKKISFTLAMIYLSTESRGVDNNMYKNFEFTTMLSDSEVRDSFERSILTFCLIYPLTL